MLLQEMRIQAFSRLGDSLENLSADIVWNELLDRLVTVNPFFTPENVNRAVKQWRNALCYENLTEWLAPYTSKLGDAREREIYVPQSGERPSRPSVAIVMAGNLPLVGFHDYLCGMICGYDLQIKMSSKDNFLLPFLHERLLQLCDEGDSRAKETINPIFGKVCFKTDELRNFDAIIATGSGNTFRYFEYYFGKYPNILRHNRSSCAVLDNTESDKELSALADDVFAYYGLGCRSVSKLYVPEGYDFMPLLDAFREKSMELCGNESYRNNYDYYKSIFLVNRQQFFDTGGCMLLESEKTASPMSVIHYEYYKDIDNCRTILSQASEQLQCVVGHGYVPFGCAQSPALYDYADGIDTMDFMCDLQKKFVDKFANDISLI